MQRNSLEAKQDVDRKCVYTLSACDCECVCGEHVYSTCVSLWELIQVHLDIADCVLKHSNQW